MNKSLIEQYKEAVNKAAGDMVVINMDLLNLQDAQNRFNETLKVACEFAGLPIPKITNQNITEDEIEERRR